MYCHAAGSCPNAARASSEVISLPLHMSVTCGDVERIADLLIQYSK
jgi:dTDP-4-amino-4,6-dideoxygalactose transaminase